MTRSVIILGILLMLTPMTLSAADDEGLLPALCRNIIAYQDNGGPVATIERIVEKVKNVPGAVVAGATDQVNRFTHSIVETFVPEKKLASKLPELASKVAPKGERSKVLGSKTSNQASAWEAVRDKGKIMLDLLMEHWAWTLGGLATLFIAWRLMRP